MIFSDDDNNTSDLESNDFIRSLGNYSFNEEFVGVDEPMVRTFVKKWVYADHSSNRSRNNLGPPYAMNLLNIMSKK